jgi:hypothetical protein
MEMDGLQQTLPSAAAAGAARASDNATTAVSCRRSVCGPGHWRRDAASGQPGRLPGRAAPGERRFYENAPAGMA